jgi:hypothetical protein
MSDVTDPEIKFEHYVKATLQVCEEFRDVMVEHMESLLQEAINTSGRSGVPAHQNKMHRMRMALDNVCNALRDVY